MNKTSLKIDFNKFAAKLRNINNRYISNAKKQREYLYGAVSVVIVSDLRF